MVAWLCFFFLVATMAMVMAVWLVVLLLLLVVVLVVLVLVVIDLVDCCLYSLLRVPCSVFLGRLLQGPVVYGQTVSVKSMHGKGKYLRVTSSGSAVFARWGPPWALS